MTGVRKYDQEEHLMSDFFSSGRLGFRLGKYISRKKKCLSLCGTKRGTVGGGGDGELDKEKSNFWKWKNAGWLRPLSDGDQSQLNTLPRRSFSLLRRCSTSKVGKFPRGYQRKHNRNSFTSVSFFLYFFLFFT